MKELPVSRLLIELDALLDTRLATLATMGDDTIDKAIEASYYERYIDRFPNIDNDDFKHRYDNRTRDILPFAMMTPMGYLLKDFAKKTLELINNSPFHMKPEIVINTYPYVLEPEEISIIITAVKAVTLGICDINIVHMSYEEITPKYVKSTYTILILYDYTRWLETQSLNENFKKTICPDITLLAPAIYFKIPNKNEISDKDPFEAMERLVSPLIGLRLMPIRYFSLQQKREDN